MSPWSQYVERRIERNREDWEPRIGPDALREFQRSQAFMFAGRVATVVLLLLAFVGYAFLPYSTVATGVLVGMILLLAIFVPALPHVARAANLAVDWNGLPRKGKRKGYLTVNLMSHPERFDAWLEAERGS